MNITPGVHLGRYEVRAPLGAGGMGEVYIAYDHDLDREVAIKVLRYGATDADRVHRFVQEAKAASALNHPNVAHVYEIGSHDALRFIVMELVAGETLRARIARGTLSVDDAIDIAVQITAALGAAHKAGIIHRDIKPENVMIRPDGYVKVLDFGLAKLRESRPNDSATVVKTAEGMAVGSLGYMAPEQLAGSRDVAAAADVYSIGVVLYEMVTGHRLDPAKRKLPDVPPKLNAVITKALEQDPKNRFPSAVEMHDELRQISRISPAPAQKSALPALRWIAAILLIAVATVAVWSILRARRMKEAKAMIPRAEQLYAEHKYPESYDVTMQAAAIVPNDDRLLDLITKVTQKVSITSEPSGATVYLERFRGPSARVRAGTTPLELPRLLRADYLVTLEKNGFASATRPLSIAPIWNRDYETRRMPGALQMTLLPSSKMPPKMVFVSGGPYRLQGWFRASDRAPDLRDFFIDRFEVSNHDFEEFVRDGGYRRRELWKGLPVAFDIAMKRFVDTTGLPGPRSWSGGAPPEGRENFPVTDVTWYEAAAFAEWSGKKLPTIFQWEKAGRYPGTRGAATSFPWGFVAEGVDVTERANFLGKGTVPVDSMQFGMSTWGAHHMAGNVSEWVRNAMNPGHAARGGSWNDATYAFGLTAAFPPFYSSATLGFRCVKETAPGDSGDVALSDRPVAPTYKAVDDRTFEDIRKRYDYAHTPLNARVIETHDTPDWRREKISFDGGAKTPTIAYLYLPRGFRPPFQVIHFTPAGDVENGLRSLSASIESKMVAHIRSGRAIFSVAMEGYIDRPRTTQFEEPDPRESEYVDYVVSRVTELRRGLDYLETRKDIDGSRIAFEADSAGVWAGVVLVAVDPRYRSALFVGSGVEPREVADATAANRINFLPHITAPKLTLQGRYDESAPYVSEFEPFYRLLPQPKRAVIYEGPHVPPLEVYLRESQKWFDETLGKVGS
jgi:formylglycine-generating enzyme required for sulfatase activity